MRDDDPGPGGSVLSDGLGLVERLRFLASGQDDPHSVALTEAADEIERLRDVLLRLQQWADAYPVEVFPEMLRQDWQRANALLAEKGISMSCMSASIMRHVLNGARAMLSEGLRA